MSEADISTLLNRLNAIEGKIDGVEHRFDGFENRFNGFESRFNGMEDRLKSQIWQTVFTVQTALFGIVGLSLLLFRSF